MSPFYHCADVTEITLSISTDGSFCFTDLRIDRDNGSGLHEPKTGNIGAYVVVRCPVSCCSNLPTTTHWRRRGSVGSSPFRHRPIFGRSYYYGISIVGLDKNFLPGADDWIDLTVYFGLDGFEASAWSVDGDGDSYPVDVNIEYDY